ncbi:hypothetical protein GCM10025868_43110 [Angustibacter aerolatus]|uniref:DUF3043 domain-containing protein n=1 Tax=Angustibacter aerolatus TaxID=1162965 RepID=A0ABQ6JQU5_9ACTN|nr:DUF3043 domain-containing protein [Angustibacter aerolatus]GMA89061.1 hypothetical protein GCM10025868_43110 [Angustibacter aerolatus]
MLGRRKQPEAPVQQAPAGPGKNKPTPKRSAAVAARKQPLVAAKPTGPRGKATKDQKDAQRVDRANARARMMAGDEAYLPARDKGPVRRYVRDVVDARRSIGEYLLPLMLVFLVLSYAGQSQATRGSAVFTAIFGLIYLVVVASAVDAFLLARRLKKEVNARFGDGTWSGLTTYAVMRTFQIRRTRVPKPGVDRGQPPRR